MAICEIPFAFRQLDVGMEVHALLDSLTDTAVLPPRSTSSDPHLQRFSRRLNKVSTRLINVGEQESGRRVAMEGGVEDGQVDIDDILGMERSAKRHELIKQA